MRKEYAVLVRRHGAAVAIQKWVKGKRVRNEYKKLCGASAAIQSGTIGVLLCFDAMIFPVFSENSLTFFLIEQ